MNISPLFQYSEQYNTCINREKRVGGGLERQAAIYQLSDKREQFCYRRTLHLSGVKQHYFAEHSDFYPYERRYKYCEHFCSIQEFDGRCAKKDEEIPEKVVVRFLESKARFGDLVQRLQLINDD